MRPADSRARAVFLAAGIVMTLALLWASVVPAAGEIAAHGGLHYAAHFAAYAVFAFVWGRGPWQGDSYEGQFRADKRHGFGTYHWASGDVYSGPWKDDRVAGPATPMMRAYAKFEEEARKAVVRQGQKVCRRMPVGIALHEWIRGEVVAIGPQKVAIRIDEPGHYGEEVAGVPIKKGDTVWDDPVKWTPCM